jgi:hypothetical protein
VALADAIVQAGILVLRFDFHGLGDSEGTIDEPIMADLYGSVSLGRYADGYTGFRAVGVQAWNAGFR